MIGKLNLQIQLKRMPFVNFTVERILKKFWAINIINNKNNIV